LNTKWTEEEKEKFFTALGRCGKGNLQEISRRIGTKSLVEVTAYVDLLNEETIWRKQLKRRKVFDLRKVPAAVEVDEKWLVFEEKMATKMAKKSDIMIEMEVDQDLVLNIEKANELAEWYFESLRIINNGLGTKIYLLHQHPHHNFPQQQSQISTRLSTV